MQTIRYLNGKKLDGAMPALLLPPESIGMIRKQFSLPAFSSPAILKKEKSEGSVNDA